MGWNAATRWSTHQEAQQATGRDTFTHPMVKGYNMTTLMLTYVQAGKNPQVPEELVCVTFLRHVRCKEGKRGDGMSDHLWPTGC